MAMWHAMPHVVHVLLVAWPAAGPQVRCTLTHEHLLYGSLLKLSISVVAPEGFLASDLAITPSPSEGEYVMHCH